MIWLADRMENDGQTFQDAIKLLRQTKFPDSYDPYHWVTGMKTVHCTICISNCKTQEIVFDL